jgi:truncated hemoglobin YjbI
MRWWPRLFLHALACCALAVTLSSCSCDDESSNSPQDLGVEADSGNDAGQDLGNNGEPDLGDDVDAGNNGEMTSYERLGGREGVIRFVADFAGRLLEDPKINAYFLNGATDIDRVVECLVLQVTVATGGPGAYPDGEGRCRPMAQAHAGLGISQQDYDDVLGHLVAAGKDQDVPDDILEQLSALYTETAFVADIIEDPTSDASVYQRVGRKPAIDAVVDGFLGRVVLDSKINGYFLNDSLDDARLAICLKRQFCGLAGGPCVYGDERIDPDQPAAEEFDTACRSMLDTHAGLGISQQDYDDLLAHLVEAAAARDISPDDLAPLAAALTAPEFVSDVVEDPSNDGSIYQEIGRKPGLDAVVSDFLERVLADPQINGFFSEADSARLGTCLVRQLCEATGGPCRYGEGVENDLKINDTIVPCRAMATSHTGVTNPPGVDDAAGITLDDFAALIRSLAEALMAAEVPEEHIVAIMSALEPLCSEIVADPGTCDAD